MNAPALKLRQVQYLRFCADGPPDRAVWMCDGKRLGPAEGDPPAEATHLLAYRLGDGAGAMKGEARDRTTLSVSDLVTLRPCFAEPWRTLNPYGRALAEAGAGKRLNLISLRCTDDEIAALTEAAEAEGAGHVSQVVRKAVAQYLADRRPMSSRLAYSGPAALPTLGPQERFYEGVRVLPGQSLQAAIGIRRPNPQGRRLAELSETELRGIAAIHWIGGRMSVTDAWDQPIPFARLYATTLAGEPFEAFTDETYTTTFGPYVAADASGVFPHAYAPEGTALRHLVVRPDGTPLLRFTTVAGEGHSLGEAP